jgi:hypothetical protein
MTVVYVEARMEDAEGLLLPGLLTTIIAIVVIVRMVTEAFILQVIVVAQAGKGILF